MRRFRRFFRQPINSCAELTEIEEKAFALQWVVSATEVRYDLETRRKWLARWSEISNWAADPYCLHLKAYQEGVSAFFDCSLKDSELRFKLALELAQRLEYRRGQMRALFHLGLIYRDRGQVPRTQAYFEKALDLARLESSSSFILRIQEQLSSLEEKNEIEKLILSSSFQKARTRLLEAEIERRRRKVGRRRTSLSI